MKKKENKCLWAAPAAIGGALGLAALWAWQNNSVTVARYRCGSHKLAPAFDGFVVLQVSDLHNKTFGQGQRRLLTQIAAEQPDCIVVTGDLIDCHRTNLAAAMEFIRGAVRLAPVYYTPGNHEGRSPAYPRLRDGLEKAGVAVLEDQKVCLARKGSCIELLGLRDPAFLPADKQQDNLVLERRLSDMMEGDPDVFRLLLSHRPELLPLYAQCGVDMALCGHAHGGQFRLFRQGLFAPGQGLFPQYSSGVHIKGATAMVVSRGLGNSEFPLRLNNRPELVKLTLCGEGGEEPENPNAPPPQEP